MKKLVCLILSVSFLVCPLEARRRWVPKIASGAVTYQFVETFEGSQTDSQGETGYDNTGWTSSSAALNTPRYATTPAPLAGSYSVLTTVASWIQHDFVTTSSKTRLFFAINVTTKTDNTEIFDMRDVSNATVVNLVTRPGDVLRASCGGVNSSEFATFAQGVTYYIWVEYTTGTGSDAILDVFVSTTTTKPSATLHQTNGGATTNASYIRYEGAPNSIYDNVVMDVTQDIGSNPVP